MKQFLELPSACIYLGSIDGITIDIGYHTAIVRVVWANGNSHTIVDFQQYDDLGRAKLSYEEAEIKAKEHFNRWNKIHHEFREWKVKCKCRED